MAKAGRKGLRWGSSESLFNRSGGPTPPIAAREREPFTLVLMIRRLPGRCLLLDRYQPLRVWGQLPRRRYWSEKRMLPTDSGPSSATARRTLITGLLLVGPWPRCEPMSCLERDGGRPDHQGLLRLRIQPVELHSSMFHVNPGVSRLQLERTARVLLVRQVLCLSRYSRRRFASVGTTGNVTPIIWQ